jgi:hypothetical protein
MAELKTRQTNASVQTFLRSIADDQRRQDCITVLKIMKEATGARPRMWGSSIVGFGTYHYRYRSGREGDWFLSGFSPRKQDLTLYVMSGVEPYRALLGKLGKHKTGKCCLYIKRLADIDLAVLKQILGRSLRDFARTQAALHPGSRG